MHPPTAVHQPTLTNTTQNNHQIKTEALAPTNIRQNVDNTTIEELHPTWYVCSVFRFLLTCTCPHSAQCLLPTVSLRPLATYLLLSPSFWQVKTQANIGLNKQESKPAQTLRSLRGQNMPTILPTIITTSPQRWRPLSQNPT